MTVLIGRYLSVPIVRWRQAAATTSFHSLSAIVCRKTDGGTVLRLTTRRLVFGFFIFAGGQALPPAPLCGGVSPPTFPAAPGSVTVGPLSAIRLLAPSEAFRRSPVALRSIVIEAGWYSDTLRCTAGDAPCAVSRRDSGGRGMASARARTGCGKSLSRARRSATASVRPQKGQKAEVWWRVT